MKIVVLTENTVYRQGILAEHGLSLYIENEEKKYLFDVGQSGIFLENAKALDIDLAQLDGIILSHGHYDHCGGMEAYAERYPLPQIYVRKEAFEKKFHQKKTNCREIGIPWSKDFIQGHVIFTEELQEMAKDVFVLGKIPLKNEFESVARGMLVEVEGQRQPDTMTDEQMLIIRSEKGLCVFLGCSHVGIINALLYIEEIFPGEHIHLLLAGMHLSGAGETQRERTLRELEKRDIDRVIPVHCTGILAIAQMKQRFGERCEIVHAGSRVVLI
jgi:7,8-dihydropterin-6-yl-methyl-4-(beta-D-ribofuranosyl)aminobenzene 5'-phosphate synthase